MLTKVKIQKTNDVLTENTIELDIPRKTRILSEEPYVRELYLAYEGRTATDLISELSDGDVVDAVVCAVGKDTATLDINPKQSIQLNIKKEDPEYRNNICVGETIKVKISKREGSKEYSASYTGAIQIGKFNDIKESIGKAVAFRAKVTELVHAGYFLTIDGIKVFMPGSLAGMNKLWDFESLLGKELIVMAINFSSEKGTIVVSHREYLKTLVPTKLEEINNSMDTVREGFVTGCTAFGVFVEFETCLTGLIPSQELEPELKKKFDIQKIVPGDKISFKVKEIINDRKIILTQIDDDPWKDAEERLKPMGVHTAKILKVTNYGAFMEIEKGIMGLLHSSECDIKTLKEGDMIEVILHKVDFDNKRIVLKKN